MDNFTTHIDNKPAKLVPVLIGGAAMAATAIIPFLNLVNCLCCAGIMGGAVLSAFFYKKNFPDTTPFTTGDGAAVGTLSGIVGAVLYSLYSALIFGLSSAGVSVKIDEEFSKVFQQMESSGQDVQALEQIREFVMQVAESPILLFLVILAFSILLFVAFGALGGVIGGSIFKTKNVSVVPPSQQSGPIS